VEDILHQIDKAFTNRAYPGDENITCCTYDKKNGGKYDAPCGECVQIAEFFGGKFWRELSAKELRSQSGAGSLLTTEAYGYYLPAYLTAAIRDPEELDVCLDDIPFAFGPEPKYAYGQERLSKILGILVPAELQAVLSYLRYVYDQEEDYFGYYARAISNIERALSKGPTTGAS
jgi:hypothetical protein